MAKMYLQEELDSGNEDDLASTPGSKARGVNLEAHLEHPGVQLPLTIRYSQAQGMCGKRTSMLIFSLSPRDLST